MENFSVNSKTPKKHKGVLLAESSSGCCSRVALKPSAVDQAQGAGGSSAWMLFGLGWLRAEGISWEFQEACGSLTDPPPSTKDVHVLIPGICGFVTVCDKTDFAAMVN